MSDFELKVKEVNEIIKELFDFNEYETQFKHINDLFTNLITKNSLKYFINLLEFYSRCRPHQHNVSTELTKCIYSCYPEEINQIQ